MGEGLILLQRYSWYILQPQPTGQSYKKKKKKKKKKKTKRGKKILKMNNNGEVCHFLKSEKQPKHLLYYLEFYIICYLLNKEV